MLQILIADNDKHTRRHLQDVLSGAGYIPFTAGSAKEALNLIRKFSFHLLLINVALSGMDGYQFTKLLRDSRYDFPILMLAPEQFPENIRRGILSGADDYMVISGNDDELLLRIYALLRRARISTVHTLSVGKTTLNYDALSVRRGEENLTLPPKEFLLLYKLLSNPDKIFTRIQLLDDIWGPETDSMESTVSVHINRLRNHFKNNPDFRILTVRGLGYKSKICQP